MTKTSTFVNGLAAVATLTAGLTVAQSAMAAEELQMSYFVGQRHPMVKAVVVPLQEKLAEISGGELTVKVHFGGSLVKGGPPQYGALLQGVSKRARIKLVFRRGRFMRQAVTGEKPTQKRVEFRVAGTTGLKKLK